jgi:predicted DNA-binding protein
MYGALPPREWIKLYSEELNDLYSSANIIRVIKSGIMRWAGHIVRMGKRRSVWSFGGET